MLENIKPGYALEVTTWENDADNYSTDIIFGLTLEQVESLKKLLYVFGANHDDPNFKRISNNHEEDMDVCYYLIHKACDQTICDLVNNDFSTEYKHNENATSDEYQDQVDAVIEWLCDNVDLSHEYYNFRVVDSFEVAKINSIDIELIEE